MTDSSNGLYERYIDVLLGQISSCRFLSPTAMDRVEAAINDRSSAERYVGYLLDVLEEERYPSPQLLDRVSSLINALDRR